MRTLGLAMWLAANVACNDGSSGPDSGNGGGGGSNGSDWVLTSGLDAHLDVQGVGAIGGRLFATTNNDVVTSSNGDTGWAPGTGLNSQGPAHQLGLDGTAMLVGADNVYRSTDDGSSWTSLHAVPTVIDIVSVSAFGQTLLSGMAPIGRVVSGDHGATWGLTNLNGLVTSTVQIGSVLIAGGGYGITVARSADNGVNWTDINQGLAAMETVQGLAVSGTTVLAGTAHGVYVSADNGDSWTLSSNGIPTGSIQITSMLSDGANVYAGTEDGVFKSTNAGASWAALGTLPSPTRVQSMTAFNGQLYGGMYSNGVWHHAL